MRAEVDNYKPRVLGVHTKIRLYSQTYAGSGGLYEINDLPNLDLDLAYKAIHIDTASANNVLKATQKIASQDIFKEVTRSLLSLQEATKNRTVQTGIYSLNFNSESNRNGFIPMGNVSDFRTEITFSGAQTTFKIYTEEIRGLAAIVSKV